LSLPGSVHALFKRFTDQWWDDRGHTARQKPLFNVANYMYADFMPIKQHLNLEQPGFFLFYLS